MSELNETSELHEVAAQLRSSKPTVNPMPTTFKIQLRTRLLASKTTPNPDKRLSTKNYLFPTLSIPTSRLSFIMLIVIFALLTIHFTPVGQIIADALLLQFGPFMLTDQPSAIEKSINTTQESAQSLRTEVIALTEASEIAGFTVLYPDFLPKAYIPKGTPTVDMVYNQQGDVSSVRIMLFHQDNQKILYYTQKPYIPNSQIDLIELGIGDAVAVPITLSNGEGVWLENLNWGIRRDTNNGDPILIPYNVLIWQSTLSNGETFLFWLGSEAQLPREEMLHIAESLSPAAEIK